MCFSVVPIKMRTNFTWNFSVVGRLDGVTVIVHISENACNMTVGSIESFLFVCVFFPQVLANRQGETGIQFYKLHGSMLQKVLF